MGLKAWGAKTTPHRKTEANLKAENSALRMNNLVAEKSAAKYLMEIWQPKIRQPNICRGVKAQNWALIGKNRRNCGDSLGNEFSLENCH